MTSLNLIYADIQNQLFLCKRKILGMYLTWEGGCLETEWSATVQRKNSKKLTVLEMYTLYKVTKKKPNSKLNERRKCA